MFATNINMKIDDTKWNLGAIGTEPETKVDGFPFMIERDIMDMEPPEYVIDGWLPEDSLMLLYGRSQSAKSFASLHMALCITHGMPWYGHEVKQGAVVYVAAEGTGGFGKRVKAWKTHYGYGHASPFITITSPVNLSVPEDAEKLLRQLKGMEQEYGFKIVLEVFDTMARCMAGSEESSNTAMGLVVENAEMIRREMGNSALGVHHTGKNEAAGPRGASALFAAVNTSILVERDGQDKVVTLNLDKQKDDEAGLFITLEMVKVPLPDSKKGKAQDSIVLVEANQTIKMAEPVEMPGTEVDTIHADLVTIACCLPHNSRLTVTKATVMAFKNGKHRDRTIDAVPTSWVRVAIPNGGVRQLRRVKGEGSGQVIECLWIGTAD